MKAPPLLLGYPSSEAFLKQTEALIPKSEAKKFAYLATNALPPVTSVTSLAVLFQYSPRFVVAMAIRTANYYRRFTLPKGTRRRNIDAPRVSLKLIQSWFGHHFARAINLNDCVHGFVPGRSTVSAAKEHCLAKWVLSLDIKDFFPSVDEDRVVQILCDQRYTPKAARLLARLFTLNGRLPQGAPTSPVLANLAFDRTDRRLCVLALKHGLKYTRYADDLIFSSTEPCESKAIQVEIIEAIRKDGWVIATRKTRLTHAPHRMDVLGLVVNGESPRLPKSMRNQIRLMTYQLERGERAEKELRRLRGYVAYAKSVEGEK